jgi:transglutaminase-like putative cysteine protease
MLVRVGCEFQYEIAFATPSVLQIQPRPDGEHRLLREHWEATPEVAVHEYHDMYGNICRRLTMPPGSWRLLYDAVVEVPERVDDINLSARQAPVEELPDETLIYTMPSRYCLSDALSDTAWELFGPVQPGWPRVQAICDWVHNSLQFAYGASNPLTTSHDVYQQRRGVCRDFAQLAVTFCRALNIPARYVFGYLPDIDVPLTDAAMDFCAWFEAYIGDRWYTFDPRNNTPRKGRVLIGRGRDALDVAMVTSYGAPLLRQMTVWADEWTGSLDALPPVTGKPVSQVPA